MPMTPNIIQTMKQTVKASVLTIRTERARPPPWGFGAVESDMEELLFLHVDTVAKGALREHPSVEPSLRLHMN
jgi:hypothetical protein